jgi:membrane protease YdiL (CAAX protease family)
MSTHAVRPHPAREDVRLHVSQHWTWLAGAFIVAFLVPFVFADVLEINRDLYYGIYAAAVVGLFFAWSRFTGYDLRTAIERRWPWALGLALAVSGVLAVMVLRTEDSTARPDGLELVGAVAWRGVVYGLADGLLLSAFPILVVFAAMAGTRLDRRFRGKIVIGIVALIASLAMTAVYHAGYSDFRGEKIRKPLTGDVMWSIPTLVTLNPIGAPIAHASMHTTAVLHSYETDTFLPPH